MSNLPVHNEINEFLLCNTALLVQLFSGLKTKVPEKRETQFISYIFSNRPTMHHSENSTTRLSSRKMKRL